MAGIILEIYLHILYTELLHAPPHTLPDESLQLVLQLDSSALPYLSNAVPQKQKE